MDWPQFFGVAAAIVSIATGWVVVKDVYAGRNFPQRSGWLIWFTLNCIFIATQWAEGARYSLTAVFISTLYMLMIAPKLKSQGVGGFDRKDKVSLGVAVLGLGLWAITNEPLIALLLSLVVDIAGTWLIVEKTYRLPWSETKISWQAGIFTQGAAILAVLFGEISFEILIIPIYFFIVTIVMSWIIHARRKVIPNPETADSTAS